MAHFVLIYVLVCPAAGSSAPSSLMTMVIATARNGTKPLPLVLLFRHIYDPATLTASKGAQNPVLRRLYRMLDMVVADPVVVVMAAPG